MIVLPLLHHSVLGHCCKNCQTIRVVGKVSLSHAVGVVGQVVAQEAGRITFNCRVITYVP